MDVSIVDALIELKAFLSGNCLSMVEYDVFYDAIF